MRSIVCCVFTALFFIACDCGIDESELLLTDNELLHFSSFANGDTIVYLGDKGHSDTIIVEEITPTIEQFDINCGFLSNSPTNEKSIFIRNHPNNIYPFSSWETRETATEKTEQWMFSFQVVANPRDVNMIFNFKNFSFVSNNYEALRIEKDTTIGDFQLSSYYKLPHVIPENQIDSSYIDFVYWTMEEGIVSYENLDGEIFVKEN
jgi:hypothetical protein